MPAAAWECDFSQLSCCDSHTQLFSLPPKRTIRFYLWMGLQSPSSGGATLTERPVEGGCGGDNIAAVAAGGEMINREDTDGLERKLRLKVDIRLCTIAGILCSLNLLDSVIISSASVTSMMTDLSLEGNRYSVAIFIFTIASVIFQLPSTVAACPYPECTPGLTYLISTWYTREEQQLRFAFLQAGEVSLLASGNIMNYGLNLLGGRSGLEGWRWMFLVNGLITIFFGIITYWWMIDQEMHIIARSLPDGSDNSDGEDPTMIGEMQFPSPVSFFCEPGRDFAVILPANNPSKEAWALIRISRFYYLHLLVVSQPHIPYYYAIIPVLLTSLLGDKLRLRGPLIVFNSLSLIAGFLMLGLPASQQVTVRYIGIFLATGAYVSNWAALNAYQANNIVGQWKRATVAASVTACNGLGGIAGSFIVKSSEAPTYETAVWVSIGSHILILVIVIMFSVYFHVMNRQQRASGKIIEGVDGFHYTY
ncbi:MFS transporter [Histoplasma capsulatum H143]|uniref:MFS transporter n=1 Tax=Ajellomyces capsulatus (strain H143) TaxID=544712 RepID=C6HL65_AJECH|nr:MFS transporter [Histoplasma capsulatum H143]